MRPIHLSVAGLHSFREKQEVDFSALCEGGVFGIFGPTGSGKSSLLDAMTLALYGKVERASNNTQGILNHAEDELKVSFTFELGNADGLKRYKVERSFKRTGDVSLRTSICRLFDLTAEKVVMAEKMNDVNQCVHDLLGLTIDDFTRAVVLPQGKFAEFLSLKDSERRQMLQRLFNLEKYGDQLGQKLRERVNNTKSELKEINAEQAGLGDASNEALTAAQNKLKESDKLLNKAEAEHKTFEQTFEHHKQIWHWQEERLEIEKQLESLNKDRDQISKLEKNLEKSQEANQLKPYLEELAYSQQLKDNWEKRLKTVEHEVEKSKEAYTQLSDYYDQAKTNRKIKEPKLLSQKEQYLQAQELQNELIEITKAMDQLKKELVEQEKELSGKEQDLTKAKSLREKGLERQRELKEELLKYEVKVENREHLRKANELKQRMNMLNQSLKDVEKEKHEYCVQIEQQKGQIEHITEQIEKAKDSLEMTFKNCNHLYHLVCERDKELERTILILANTVKQKNKQLEHEKVKQLAHSLAHSLQEGSPCPVCGATEHPSPTKEQVSDISDIQQEIETLEEAREQGKEMKYHITSFKTELEKLSERIIEASSNENPLVFDTNYEVKEIVEENYANLQSLLKKVNELFNECRMVKQDVLQVEEVSQTSIKNLTKLQQELAEKNVKQQSLHDQLDKVEVREVKLAKDYEEELNKWTDTFSELEFDMIEKELQLVIEKERKAADIHAGIEKSIPFLQQKDEEISTLQTELNQLQVSYAEKKSTFNASKKTVEERTSRINQIVGEKTVQQCLQEVSTLLGKLQQDEEKGYEQMKASQQKLNELENEQAAAIQSVKDSAIRFKDAQLKWDKMISETSFQHHDEVKFSFAEKEQILEWKQKIDHFWDQVKKFEAALEKLINVIGDEELTQEKWLELNEKRKTIQQKVSELREAKGAASEMLLEIEKKHVRYNELENKKIELEKMQEKLGKLQQVFRGNTFVEFIAEEQLMQVSRDASERLGQLTRGRYAIEVDSSGGFVIRDDANGGVKRPVSTLSGGETFLTSLALALSLSAQIQLRGEYPLEFFFLDEGFGTLDQELLDTVITALEKLQYDQLSVGVISHVQELRARLPRKLIVEPAEPSGRGSLVSVETL